MSLLANSNAIESGGYNIDRSLRFRSSASAYLSRTPASAGNRQTWTWSGWVKRGQLSIGRSIFVAETSFSQRLHFGFDPTDVISVYGEDGGVYVSGTTNAVFRDPSAFYHVVFAWDTTQATAANRVKLFINGVQTALTLTTTPAQNANGVINAAVSHFICAYPRATQYFDGLLTEVNFIDGQALTPSSFGQTDPTTGVWVPKRYVGTYGTNGFYLDFKDNTSATMLAYDKSGNSNNWTPNNISTTAGATYDSMTDVPTLTSATAANFAVLSGIDKNSTVTLSNGNLQAVCSATGIVRSTIGMQTGKWYWETIITTIGGGCNTGLARYDAAINNFLGSTAASWGYNGNSNVYNNSTSVAVLSSYTTGDIIGVAFDADTGKLWFAKNGTWLASGNPSAGTNPVVSSLTSGPYFAAVSDGTGAATTLTNNFGAGSGFSYTPPTGFKALNTFNLPDPTIKKGSTGMNVVTYTGDGTNNRSITGVGFQPDLVWVKSRSNAYDHQLVDSVRGAGKELYSNLTLAETAINTVPAFVSDGFQVNGGTYAGTNGNGATFAAWCWKKGATPGFDIVTFTSPASGNFTVNHSLGVTPAMVIVKTRDTAGWNWHVWHKSLASATNSVLVLNSTAAVNSSFNMWGAAGATSTTIGITTGNPVPANSACVAYLFAEIAGFSKFGSYTGNGSADGPFVYCGFRPRFILLKDTSVASQWYINDTARNTFNLVNSALYPNLSNAEATTGGIDIVSNGFKVRTLSGDWNNNGENYIYAAFAENPFKYSLAR